jgi:hypothetical protein
MKEDFINKEIWILTFGASFQRAYAYVDNSSNDTKVLFKNNTTVVVENMLAPRSRSFITSAVKDRCNKKQSIIGLIIRINKIGIFTFSLR